MLSSSNCHEIIKSLPEESLKKITACKRVILMSNLMEVKEKYHMVSKYLQCHFHINTTDYYEFPKNIENCSISYSGDIFALKFIPEGINQINIKVEDFNPDALNYLSGLKNSIWLKMNNLKVRFNGKNKTFIHNRRPVEINAVEKSIKFLDSKDIYYWVDFKENEMFGFGSYIIQDGKTKHHTIYDKFGNIRFKGTIELPKGLFNGFGKYYWNDGTLLYEGSFMEGSPEGKGVHYIEGGAHRLEGIFGSVEYIDKYHFIEEYIPYYLGLNTICILHKNETKTLYKSGLFGFLEKKVRINLPCSYFCI